MIIPPDVFEIKKLHLEDYKILEQYENQEEILFEKQNGLNNIAVTKNKLGKFLKLGESYQAGFFDCYGYKGSMPYNNYFFMPLLLKRKIKNVLVLGMGTGKLARDYLSLKNDISSVDIVEFDPDIADVAYNYFGFKQDHKIEVIIQDARVFVRNTVKKYDVVIFDVFSASGLDYRFMTKEFFNEVKNILTEDGIFISNNFSSTDINNEENSLFKALYKTIKNVFDFVKIFPCVYGDYELYRNVYNLQHELSNITNVVMMASMAKMPVITADAVLGAKDFGVKCSNMVLSKIDYYVKDVYNNELDTDNLKMLTDDYLEDLSFSVENINEYIQQ